MTDASRFSTTATADAKISELEAKLQAQMQVCDKENLS